VILPGIEHQMQPWHHLLDRRQLSRRTGFAARTGLASCARFALRTGLAGRAGFALRARLAGPPGMTLRSGAAGFARASARALRPLSCNLVVRHLRTPDVSQAFS
jgi:hypothetical protein